MAENKCIDSLKGDFNSQLGLAKSNADSSDQFYAFAKSGLILTSSESCLSYAGNKVIWTICSNDVQSQSRIYNAKVNSLDFECSFRYKMKYFSAGTMD